MSLCHSAGNVECLLTDTNSDEECDIREHLPQYIPEVPFTTAVTVLHQICAPQNCREKTGKTEKKTVIQDDISICSVYRETRLDKYWSQRHNMSCLSFGYGAGKSVNALATQIHKYLTTDPI